MWFPALKTKLLLENRKRKVFKILEHFRYCMVHFMKILENVYCGADFVYYTDLWKVYYNYLAQAQIKEIDKYAWWFHQFRLVSYGGYSMEFPHCKAIPLSIQMRSFDWVPPQYMLWLAINKWLLLKLEIRSLYGLIWWREMKLTVWWWKNTSEIISWFLRDTNVLTTFGFRIVIFWIIDLDYFWIKRGSS